MKQDSKIRNLLFILIAGMGNVKQGNWKSILIYFCFIILLGIGPVYAEQKIIEKYYHPSQIVRTFLILIYIAFAFFWDGTTLICHDEKNLFIDHDEGIPNNNTKE